MNSSLATLIQILFVLAAAPYVGGLVRMFKARLQGRHGANPLRSYYGLLTLLKKQMVMSRSTSWVFRLAPFMVLTTALFLAAVLPLLVDNGALASAGNLFVVSGVLMLGAVFLVLGGLDSGSAFGGMGSEREMTIAALVEPATIATFATLALFAKSTSFDGMITAGTGSLLTHPYLWLTIAAFALIALAENARYPVDNPATHLELTMVHEAMVLEYSGPYLAMLEYASAIKLTVFALLLGNLIAPSTLAYVQNGWVAFGVAALFAVLKLILAAAALALLESTIAKMRFFRVQEYLGSAFLLALAGLILAVIHV